MSMEEMLQVQALAVVQGIAEFLPISSSGHLVVLGKLFKTWFGGDQESIVLTVTLHVGTLASLLVVYRRDLWVIWRQPKLCLAIVLATIPAAVLGITLKKYVKPTFEMPLVVACGWLVTAGFLWSAQKFGGNSRPLEELTFRDALTVGVFQAISALFRGVSRSGSTISAGLYCGLRRDAAASFSFLIAIPVTAGAALVEAAPLIKLAVLGPQHDGETFAKYLGGYSPEALLLGALTSFVVGVVSLRWLIRIIAKRGLNWFAAYCVIASLLTFGWQGYLYVNGR
ncbi:MAG: undecaprenyl-diphosphate phosphatase [Planctomycetia bacterium]|nr:undecaprenyl-diphosphate phosphatase [Planctomycetia bacterium]